MYIIYDISNYTKVNCENYYPNCKKVILKPKELDLRPKAVKCGLQFNLAEKYANDLKKHGIVNIINFSKNYNNYRPISKTPSLAKLFEKLISKRLNQFLKDNSILVSEKTFKPETTYST